MSVVVRAARGADAAAIVACWRDLLARHAELDPAFALRGGAFVAIESRLRRILRDADARVWVAEREERFAGFCAAHFEAAPAAAQERCRVAITELAVDPAARRRGVGRALAAVASDWARERGALRVEVRVSSRNAEGRAFWRSLGFESFVDVLDLRL